MLVLGDIESFGVVWKSCGKRRGSVGKPAAAVGKSRKRGSAAVGGIAAARMQRSERIGPDSDGCGHTLLGAQSGTLASRNYPGTYPNGTRCEWRVRAPRGRRLRLVFGDFNLERSQDCASAGSLAITPGNGAPLGPLCGDLDPRNRKLVLNSSEVTILFLSGTHRSGRGFLLSYATEEQTELISCMERGTHFTSPEFRAYCPAGCRDVTGDIWGQSSQGYRDTSVLCKAAIHAGVVSDDLGGPVTVSRQRSITLYESGFANGLLSKTGSLSEKKLVFHKDCNSLLPVHSYNVSSSWEEVDGLDRRRLWSPGNRDSAGEFQPWVADKKDREPWLQLELRERSSITGVLTKGWSSGSARFFTKSFTLLYSKDNRNWKAYKAMLSKERKVFVGNSDSDQEVLNSLIPPVVAKYLLLRPQQWEGRAAAHVLVLGCALLRPRSPYGAPPESKGTTDSAPYSPVPTKPLDVEKRPAESSSQPVVVVVGVVLVLIVCVGILLAGLCWKRRKRNAEKCSLEKGCQSSLGKTLPRSESELISYPLERGTLDSLPNPPLNDYAEPELCSGSRSWAPRSGRRPTRATRCHSSSTTTTFRGSFRNTPSPCRRSPSTPRPSGTCRTPPPTRPAGPLHGGPGAAASPLARYDCPAHKMAPNGYCTPAPLGADARRSSALYAEPQSGDAPAQTADDPLSRHTYYEPL
ncbi:hypothetical protein COCON_G00018930 [Conger conger]|uniref:Discoidin, CUB and LCCL domain-containing protein 1-like n=1 Tax=Conger conger TaxID=82655 RepID=A0A9Q1E436_CONCO|nr:hypothetical protein COCON_G00018930 [Conger conger]